MRMKKITMLFVFLLSAFVTYGQEVTIGTGTIIQNYPLSNYFGYQRSAALYSAAEVGQAGFITQLAWDLGTTGADRPVKIYLKEIEPATLTSATWEALIRDALPVYSGTFQANSMGYRTIALDRSFNYSGGTKNLVVLVEANFGSSGTDNEDGLNIKATAATNTHLTARTDHIDSTETLSFESNRPNVKITFGQETPCETPFPVIETVGTTSFSFSLIGVGSEIGEISYEVRTTGLVGSGETGLVTSGIATDLTAVPIEITDLDEGTEFTLYVRGSCVDGTMTDYTTGITVVTRIQGVIGEGNQEESYLPLYSNYNYNYSQMIYTAAEVSEILGSNVLIERIKFYFTGTGSISNYNQWTVYMTNTTKDSFADSTVEDWIPHGQFSEVFQGTVSLVTNNWVELVLDSPFVWDGERNLGIALYEDALGYFTGAAFGVFTTSEYRGILRYEDSFFNPEIGLGFPTSRYQYLPKLFIQGIEAPSCYLPLNINVTDITANSAVLNWDILTGSESQGIDYFISTNDTAPTSTTTPTATLETQDERSLILEDLEEYTRYYVWMKNSCEDDSRTAWTARPVVFTTGLVPVSLPYTDNFEEGQIYAFAGDLTNKWHIGNAVNNGGERSLYISNNDGVGNRYDFSTSQVSHVYKDFTIPEEAEELEVQFDWRSIGDSYDNDFFTVWAVPLTYQPMAGSDITATTSIVQLGQTMYSQNPTFKTAHMVVDATAFAGQTMRLVFQWKNNSYDGVNPPAAIDNLKLNYSTCLQPQNLEVDILTPVSLKANWTAVTGVTNYEVKITTTPDLPAESVAGTTVSTTTHTFPGLTSNTTYYIWVRSLCSTTNKSFWSGPLQATTALVPANLPYRDDFETVQQYAIINDVLNKWHIGNAINYGGQSALYISGDEGVSNVYLNNDKDQVSHVYKDFTIPANAVELGINFDWRCQGDGSASYPDDYFSVWIVPATYIPVEGVQTTIANSGGVQIGRPVYNQRAVFLNERLVLDGTRYQGQTMRLLFEWTNNSFSEYQPPAAIDNLEVHVITCSDPIDVHVDDLSESSLTVSWTPVAGQTNYEVYYSTTNGLPGQTVTGSVITSENSYTIEELTANTTYYVWVRTICSTTSKSSWVRVVAITSQIPAEMPFVEDFEGDNNWTIGDSPVNEWFIGFAASNGGRNGLYITNDGGLTNAYVIDAATVTHIYRDMAVPERTTDCLLTFDWRCMGELSWDDSKTDFFNVWLVPVAYNPTNGQRITPGDNHILVGSYNNEEEFVEVEEVINLSAYAGGTMRLVLEWVQNAWVGTQPPAAVDNINITPLVCPAVVNLQSEVIEGTSSSVLLTWDAKGDETQWEVYIVLIENETPPADNTAGIIVDTNSYVYVNPNSGTTEDQFYRFYVRPLCSEDDKGSWSEAGVVSFIPPPGCARVDATIEFSDLGRLETNEKGEYIICENGTVNLALGASYYDILKTNTYRVDPIEYKPPFPFKGGGAIELTTDDVWSDVIDLGFDFCFYGNKYDKILINTNGTITFSIAGVIPGGRYVPNAIGAAYNPVSEIPSDPGSQPLGISDGPTINSIMGVFQDTHPGVEIAPGDHSINYQIIGKAPCRTLVFNVYHLGMYGDSPHCAYDPDDVEGTTQTSQIVMYEGTNIIEVYVKNRHSLCDEWEGNAVIGIQNEDGTDGIAAPGRNTGRWEAQNEAWRFTPDGDSTAEFFWEKDGEFYSTEAKIDVQVSETVTYTAKAKYEICGDETVLYKEFKFVKEDFIMGTPAELVDCARPIGEVNFVDLSSNDSLILGDLDPSRYVIEYFESEADMNENVNPLDTIYEFQTSRILYVKMTNKFTGCNAFKTFNVTLQSPLNVTVIQDQSACGAYVFPAIKEGEAFYTEEYGQGDKYESGDSFDLLGIHTFYIYRADEKGCMSQTSFTLEVIDQPMADVIPDQVMQCNRFTLPALGKYNKYFTLPDGKGKELEVGTPIFEPQTIYVYGYNEGKHGAVCIDEHSFTVSFEECPIPKGFSPNGDGINDSFDLSEHGVAKLQIFNRNGVEVYAHGVGYKNQWVGQNKSGKLLPVGTYYYVVVSNGKIRTGWVQLNY